jgi:hypothetical protein
LNAKVPQPVNDVYRDLRDRRLLLPAIALLIGLVAVPFLLKGSDAPPPPPAPVAGETGGSELTAAVLADEAVKVRNYRKRLDALKFRNPFKPRQTAAPASGEEAEGSGSAGGGTAATTDDTGGAAPAVTDVTDVTVDESSATVVEEDGGSASDGGGNGNGGGGNGGGGGGGNGGNQPSGDDVEVVSELFTHRVDVMIGIQGDPKLRENVKPMTILPNEAAPVVAFLGTDEAGERAAFAVAKDATLSGGTAACVPAPENCLYITLQKGETATLDFGPDGQTYELRLLEIRDVELKTD